MPQEREDTQSVDTSRTRSEAPPAPVAEVAQHGPNGKEPNASREGAGQQPQPEGPSRRKRSRWLWLLIILLIVAGVFAFRHSNTAKNAQPASPTPPGAAITTGQSTTGDINVYVTALGTVTPTYTVTVCSQISGRVMAVYYHEGQMINKGDPLIEVDPQPYQASLTQAEGALAHDRGVLDQAEMDLKRYQAAYAKNAIARQILEDQEKTVIQYQGTVKADEGAVAYAQTQLSYCHIVAPISGRVGLRLVDAGNTIFAGSGSTLVVITQLQPITVVFNVSEDDLPQIQAQLHAGHSLQVSAFDRSDVRQIASGTLSSLDNLVDTTTGTVKFRANFPNRNLALFPNQFVNAKLLLKTLRKVTLVPSAAIQYNGANAFVYLVKPDNTVSVQPITTLTGNDNATAVTGVSAGVNLATSGFDRLENGVRVTVRNRGSDSPNPGQSSQNPNHTSHTQGAGGTTTP